MPDLAYINHDQQIVPLEQARISVRDRGFLFADSVYEVVRVYDGRPFRWEEHLQRLRRSLAGIRLDFDPTEEMQRTLPELLAQSQYAEAKLYIQVTRGPAPRRHAFPDRIQPTLLITVEQVEPVPEAYWQQGVKIITVPDIRWQRCDIKSTALLPNVLMHQLAKEKGAYDALFVSAEGLVRECTHCNIFIIHGGNLLTPPESIHILSGVTRRVVLEMAPELGLKTRESDFHLEELLAAEEVFLTGTLTEIMPVVAVDDRPVGDGKPGKTTARFLQAYLRLSRGKP